MSANFKVGDLVRVKRADGTLSEQRYNVERIIGREHGPDLAISQWPSTAPKGKKMAEEFFHSSLLVVDNSGPKMLADILNDTFKRHRK